MANYDAIVLSISDEVRTAMQENGVREEDLKQVIGTAEETGIKLRNEDSTCFLAKLKIEDVFFNAVYEKEAAGYKVLDAYLHHTYVTGW